LKRTPISASSATWSRATVLEFASREPLPLETGITSSKKQGTKPVQEVLESFPEVAESFLEMLEPSPEVLEPL
jgi:hypothetical protein